MLKNKIYKYFTLEILKSFLTILFALSAIAWTVRAVNFLDLVVENGHSITTYLFFSLLNKLRQGPPAKPSSFMVPSAKSHPGVQVTGFVPWRYRIIFLCPGGNEMKGTNL